MFVNFYQPGSVFPELIPYRLVLVSSLIALITYILVGKRNNVAFFSSKYARYFILFVIVSVLSSSRIWITGGIETFLSWCIYIIMFYLLVRECTSINHIKYILLMVMLAVAYLSYFSLKDIYLNYESGYRAIGYGWYENANDLSLILITTIPFAFYFIESSSNKLVRYLFIVISISFSINVLFTGSRQALLGLLTVGALCLFYSKKISRMIKIAMSVGMILAIVTVGMATVMSRGDLEGQLLGDASSENRLIQWNACVKMTLKNPILGVGPGESAYVMREYGGIQGLVPHNTLLQVFAETGIPGGIFFFLCTCYPIIGAIKTLKNEYKKNRLQDPTILIYKYLTIALLGFWSCAIFSNRVEFAILYVLIALIVACEENILKHRLADSVVVSRTALCANESETLSSQ